MGVTPFPLLGQNALRGLLEWPWAALCILDALPAAAPAARHAPSAARAASKRRASPGSARVPTGDEVGFSHGRLGGRRAGTAVVHPETASLRQTGSNLPAWVEKGLNVYKTRFRAAKRTVLWRCAGRPSARQHPRVRAPHTPKLRRVFKRCQIRQPARSRCAWA